MPNSEIFYSEHIVPVSMAVSYGIFLINLFRFCSAWRKCVRRIWNIPPTTHCNFLEHLYEGSNLELQVLCRFVSLYFNVCNSDNNIVSMCSKLAHISQTPTAVNRRKVLCLINNNGDIFTNGVSVTNIKNILKQISCNDEVCISLSNTVKEFCLIRDGHYHADIEESIVLNTL